MIDNSKKKLFSYMITDLMPERGEVYEKFPKNMLKHTPVYPSCRRIIDCRMHYDKSTGKSDAGHSGKTVACNHDKPV